MLNSSTSKTEHLRRDVWPLYEAYCGAVVHDTDDELLRFAVGCLDYRKGRHREEVAWDTGVDFTPEQKRVTFVIAQKWGMVDTNFPIEDFDQLVVLGAHASTLELRIKHALKIMHRSDAVDTKRLILLSCFRDIHPKEGFDQMGFSTEEQVGIHLLEEKVGARFVKQTTTCWGDLEDKAGCGVATQGRVGPIDLLVVSGSAPNGSVAATTLSTLRSLRSVQEDNNARSLYVTTSLHLPYQSLQISAAMTHETQKEIVGIQYPLHKDFSINSPDAQFRAVLQEVGATIKNALTLVG